jgi:hypothetical protein
VTFFAELDGVCVAASVVRDEIGSESENRKRLPGQTKYFGIEQAR